MVEDRQYGDRKMTSIQVNFTDDLTGDTEIKIEMFEAMRKMSPEKILWMVDEITNKIHDYHENGDLVD